MKCGRGSALCHQEGFRSGVTTWKGLQENPHQLHTLCDLASHQKDELRLRSHVTGWLLAGELAHVQVQSERIRRGRRLCKA
jgi:hypothetical protein